MSEHRYRLDGQTILVVLGLPEEAAHIGIGDTISEARASLEATPIQSAGRPQETADSAVRWARNQGWIDRLPIGVERR